MNVSRSWDPCAQGMLQATNFTIRSVARKGYGSITHEDEGSKLFWYHPSSQTEKAIIKLANAS